MKDPLILRKSFKAGTGNDPRDVAKIADALRVKGGDDGGETGTVSKYLSGEAGGYNVEIDFKGAWTFDLQQDIINSAELISDLILGDVGDVFYRGKIIDDIRITATLKEIDGEGGILGQAGPTAIRTADYLPALAVMEFDVADAQIFDGLGLWDEIVTHEMMHTIGFGTIWDLKGLLSDAGTASPTFTGAAATEAYAFLFDAPDATAVPVEGDGGPGTRDSHWDEETFGAELMTGYLDATGVYLSDMTVGSLEDLGYDTVWTGDYGAIV
jgi:hypothetical protein